MPVQTQMQVRRGTASSWTSTNPTLAAGELGFETNTGKFKIGNGSSTWTSLLYAGGGQSSLTTYQYTATAGQTTFSGADINSNTLAYTVGAIQVYLNGALLQNTVDFAASTGTSVVLTGGAGLGDSLTIISFATFDVANTIPVSAFTAKGQILAATGSGAYTAQAVGANGTVLMADSAEADGVKWAAPAAPTFVGCQIFMGASITLSSNSFTALNFAETDYLDTDEFHNPTSNNTRLTIPTGKGGKYLVFGNVFYGWNGPNNGPTRTRIYLNGSVFSETRGLLRDTEFSGDIATIMTLAAGDYVELYGFQLTGQNNSAIGTTGNSGTRATCFGLEFLGA